MTLEDPTYAQLQRELHHALRAQHPDWILPNGDCPTCDSYDARFAELLRELVTASGLSLTEAKQQLLNSIPIPISFPRQHEARTTMKKTKIVIAGGGFAGLYAAKYFDKHLARRPDIEVTLIARENFILFTPMLHESRRAILRLATS